MAKEYARDGYTVFVQAVREVFNVKKVIEKRDCELNIHIVNDNGDKAQLQTILGETLFAFVDGSDESIDFDFGAGDLNFIKEQLGLLVVKIGF